MKKNFIIFWEIYPFEVMVSINEKHPDLVKRIEKSGYKLDEDEKEKLWMTGNGRTVMLKGGQTIMRLNKKDYAILAHEVFHATCFLMDRIGVKFNDDCDETFAYAIEFLTRKIL